MTLQIDNYVKVRWTKFNLELGIVYEVTHNKETEPIDLVIKIINGDNFQILSLKDFCIVTSDYYNCSFTPKYRLST